MDKLHAYKLLFEIKDNHNININEYVKDLASSKNESVSFKVLNFINQYKPLPSFETVNYLHETCKTNRLYRRLMNENQSLNDKVIALTSFMNQCAIKLKSLSENYERKYYIDDLKLTVVSEALHNYFMNKDEESINEAFDLIKSTIKSISRGVADNE